MVQVYLPMGYPIQSGQEFANVIYQGSVVRLYSIPKDPRSAAQIENRNFLKDFAKMRGQAGTYTRARLRSGIATTWGSILYQYAKGDLDSYWSNAIGEWEGFTEAGRDAWRDVAPYEATYNDKGLIFFCLLRVVYGVLNVYSLSMFECELWGEFEAESALDWWVAEVIDLPLKGAYDMPVHAGIFGVEGTVVNNASAFNGVYLDDISSFEFFIYGYNVNFQARRAPGLGTVEFYFDGRLHQTLDISNGVEVWQASIGGAASNGEDGRLFKGIHKIGVVVVSGSVNIDILRVV